MAILFSKLRISIFISLFFVWFSKAQTTPILDSAFEQILVDLGIDSNGLNGNILNSDAASVTNLNLPGNTITDLTGLEAFVNLVDLNLNGHQFPTIPTTTMPNLETIRFNGNLVLDNLDLSQNFNLRLIDFRAPTSTAGGIPPITSLDISNNLLLQEVVVYNFRNLVTLDFPTVPNQISEVFLQYLNVANLDMSNLNSLEYFNVLGWVGGVNFILPTEQDVLNRIHIGSINLNTVDLSNYPNLNRIDFFSTNIQELILPISSTLNQITIWGHNFQNPISFANAPNLTRLDVRNAQTVPLVIDLTQNLQLIYLNLSNNLLNSIDVTNNVNLEELNVYTNNLTSIDVNQNTQLIRLRAYNNQLPTIDVSQNLVLRFLYLQNNFLPNLDITNNTELRDLNISNNLFAGTGLDLSQNVELNTFRASNNQIESLDILSTYIRILIIDNNQFFGNDILNQYYTVRSNDAFGIITGQLIVNNNNLSGSVPDYTNLMDVTNSNFNVRTKRFELIFYDNNFEFGDFENQHDTYLAYTQLPVPAPYNTFTIVQYRYAPQEKVNNIENFTINAGDAITLETIVSGAENHYAWFKDGVLIPDAPDSPQYTITAANPCDTAVYHCEITSDLVPFENADPPGTNNRNLLLVRNDINLVVNAMPVGDCPTLITPLDSSINNPINAVLNWTPNVNACGYFLNVGTTADSTEILNNEDVGNVTTYVFNPNLPINSTIYVSIIPYFLDGSTQSCPEYSFQTNNTIELPDCTNLTAPLNGATNVPVNTSLSWNQADFASSYKLSIGTTTGGTDILNEVNIGNVTTYTPPIDLPFETTIYVNIVPVNSDGEATGCLEENFTTESSTIPPGCASLTAPLNGATNVAINSNLSWVAVPSATGYFLSIGTTSGGTDLLNNQDVGNVTTYTPAANFPEATTIFVNITPYNAGGNATACAEESFTTEKFIPSCTTLISPLNGAINIAINTEITWEPVNNASGYILSIGTTLNGNEVLNNENIGDVTTHQLPIYLVQGQTYFVTILPYNDYGLALGCERFRFTTKERITTIQNYFTPNGDGINDVWFVLDTKNEVRLIRIFDRFGRLLTSFGRNGSWDGTFKNNPMPETDYWYLIEFLDGSFQRGHFSLVRR